MFCFTAMKFLWMKKMFRNSVRRVGSSVLASRRGFATHAKSQGGSGATFQTAATIAAVGVFAMMVFGRGSKAQAAAASAPQVTEIVEVVPEVVKVVVEESCEKKEEDSKVLATIQKRLEDLEKQVALLDAYQLNEAFVFIKPHAVTDKTDELVKEGFEKAGIKIVSEGVLSHDVIDKDKLIDKHYGAIAAKAVLMQPAELNVPDKGKADFEKMFGENWDEVKTAKVYNAADACKKLGITGAELDSKWSTLNRGENLLKFGGGFYVGKVDDIYIINGFYLSMRDKYCQAPAQIHWYTVQFDPSRLSWEDFRGKVLGATDPTEAAPGSLRRMIYENWESLGLPEVPNTGDNGLHASASPFEGSAERLNWLGMKPEQDRYARAALALGIPAETLATWMQDAQVKYNGKKQSIFDILEDKNSRETLDILASLD